jgi:hypothetical protein
MQERAHLVNGSMAIESEPGGGTGILVSVPVDGHPRDCTSDVLLNHQAQPVPKRNVEVPT